MTRKALALAAILVVAGIAGTWTFWSFFHRPALIGLDGQPIRDYSVSEMGGFADESFKPVRIAHLSNQDFYRGLPQTSLSSIDFSPPQFADRLTATLKTNPRNEIALQALPAESIPQLAVALHDLVRSLSDVSTTTTLNQGGVFRIPANYQPGGKAEASWATAQPGDAVVAEEFRKAVTAFQSFDSGSRRLKSISLDGEGVRCGIWLMNPSDASAGTDLTHRFTEDDFRYFRGQLAQGGFIFHAPPVRAATTTPVPRFEWCAIVEDLSGDRYPIWVEYRYDAAAKTWWLTNFYRLGSPKVALSSPPAF